MKTSETTGSGIFYEGRPLEDYLQQLEQQEKRQETEEDFNLTVTERSRARRRAKIRDKEAPGPRVAKRVRRYSGDEIRRLKGIAMKSLGSISNDICWLLSEGKELTTKQMAEMMDNKGTSSVSSVTSQITRVLADHLIIDRDKSPNTYVLKPEYHGMTWQELSEIYKERRRTAYAAQQAEKAVEPEVEKVIHPEPKKGPEKGPETGLETLQAIWESLGNLERKMETVQAELHIAEGERESIGVRLVAIANSLQEIFKQQLRDSKTTRLEEDNKFTVDLNFNVNLNLGRKKG